MSHLHHIAIGVLLAFSEQQQYIPIELFQSTILICVALLLDRGHCLKLGLANVTSAVLFLQYEYVSSVEYP